MGNVLHCCVLWITFPGCFLVTSKTTLVDWKSKEKSYAKKRRNKLVSVCRA